MARAIIAALLVCSARLAAQSSDTLLLRPMFLSLSRELGARADSGQVASIVMPRLSFIYNSALPYSLNDGALWAGKGGNADLTGGGWLRWKGFRMIVVPELVWSANAVYDTAVSPQFPGRLAGRSEWSSPFHYGAQSIDLPLRFGDVRILKLYPGQSTALFATRVVEFGASTENEWWGPGLRNALLLSNNAPGFPHLFARTARPITTPIGSLDIDWLAGGLAESPFFDSDRANDLRAIALVGVALEPRGTKGLTVGAARSVFRPVQRWAPALTGFLDAFRDVGHPDAVPLADTAFRAGPDQLISFFARAAFPRSGLEVHAEWARAEFPLSLRDFLSQPNHSQAYTLGLKWTGDTIARTGGRLSVAAEITSVEQGTTYRFRPIGSWYTSHSVVQGYTNQGQPLGAAIGPGSSSQWVSLDHVATRWSAGVYGTRIRWLEDARSQAFDHPTPGNGWCEQDISLLGGVRARWSGPFGIFSADYGTGWRYNVFFQHDPGTCPNNQGTDRRMKSLSVSIVPRW